MGLLDEPPKEKLTAEQFIGRLKARRDQLKRIERRMRVIEYDGSRSRKARKPRPFSARRFGEMSVTTQDADL